jgi:hypothetical protein
MYCSKLHCRLEVCLEMPHIMYFTFKCVGVGVAQSVYTLGYGLDDWCSNTGSGNFGDFLLFSTASRQALRLTQPHIRWVPGALSPG